MNASQDWRSLGRPDRDHRPGSLVVAAISVLFGLLALAIPAFPHVADMAMASVLLAIPLVLATRRIREREFDAFEVIFPISALYFTYFGFSTIYLKYSIRDLQSLSLLPWLTPALAVALLGYLAMFAGYTTTFTRTGPSKLRDWAPGGLSFFLVVGGIGFLGQVCFNLQQQVILTRGGFSAVISIGQQFAPLFYFAWFLVWHAAWNRQFSRFQAAVVFSVFGTASLIILFLLVGGKTVAIVTVAIPMIAYWYARRRFPWKSALVVVLLAILVIFPIYNNVRLQNKEVDTLTRLDRTLDVASSWNTETYFRNSVGAFFRRMGIVTSVAAVLRDVPEHVDFRYGETLVLGPVGLFVPRVLWPDKPNISIGREFGVTFLLVHPMDRITQIAPSLVGEFYWNFHLPGVVVGMFLFGSALRWFYQVYGRGAFDDSIRRGVYVMLLLRVVHFEGNVGMLFATIGKSWIILMLVLWALKKVGLVQVAAGEESSSTEGRAAAAVGPAAPARTG